MTFLHRTFLVVSVCIGLIGFGTRAVLAQSGHQHDHGTGRVTTKQAGSFGQPGSVKNVTRTIAITMTDAMRFDPSALAFKQGETVRLRITNTGKIEHEFVLGTEQEIAEHAQMMREMPDMAHADANAVRVTPGNTADIVWKFSVTGGFLYACLVPGHLEAGMRGVIAVTNRMGL